MVKRIGTSQRKTRHKYNIHYRKRGKIPLSQYFQELNKGDTVNLVVNPLLQQGRFFRRFHGMTGHVTGRQGFCYEVTIQDGGKKKTLYVHPLHLKKVVEV